MRKRDEARLEVDILRAIGSTGRCGIYKNEVGKGFHGSVLRKLLEAVPATYHRSVLAALQRSRITYGLGVGSPDLVCISGGRFVGLELKTDSGRLRPEQASWHSAARKYGAAVEVVRSVEDAEAVLFG